MEYRQPYFAVHQVTGQGLFFTREERERHVYLVGKSGSGKSTTLFNIAMGDIDAGEGVTIIDPHGDLAEAIADCIPPERTNQVCYLNVADLERPVGFNPLASVPAERRALAASGIVSAFRHLWVDSWGARTEYLLYHGVRALLDTKQASLIDLPRIYTDDVFRRRVVECVSDPITRRFWEGEFAQYTSSYRLEVTAPILNKAGQFTNSPNLRLILGQTPPKFSLEHAMSNRQIVIANLSSGTIGERATNVREPDDRCPPAGDADDPDRHGGRGRSSRQRLGRGAQPAGREYHRLRPLRTSMAGKWLELLSEIAPGLKRVAIMFNPDTAPVSSYMPSIETAARLHKVVPIIAPVHGDVEIETAISALGG